MKNALFFFLIFSLFNCSKENASTTEIIKKDSVFNEIPEDEEILKDQVILSDEEQYKNLNNDLLLLLKEKNYDQFSTYIHPEKGIGFSMYASINATSDKHFSKEDFIKYTDSNTKFTWGEKDGTGEKLVLTIKDYLEKWVYKRDFVTSDYHFNDFKAAGNSLNNLKEIYLNSSFTENYISGTEQYAGMNWNSLRFVFEELNGKKYIVAVINDEWTT